MKKYIWPERSNHNQALFVDGKKVMLIIKITDKLFQVIGDRISNVMWDVGYSINLEEVKFI